MVKCTPNDRELLKFGTSFVNLRVRDFEALTGRSKRVLQHRLQRLVIEWKTRKGPAKGQVHSGLGYFYSIPNPSNPFEKVFFPTQKGWDQALEWGLISHEVNANREKSAGQIEHDLVLTDFHKALHFAFGDKLHWSQLYKARYHRWGKGLDDYVNADAFFYVELPTGKYASFFVEIENQKGVQEPMNKMEGYLAFADGPYQEMFRADDFRVIFLKPSAEMVANLIVAAHEDKNLSTRRFWLSDYTTAQNLSERPFVTPKDYSPEQRRVTRTWGFQDLAGEL